MSTLTIKERAAGAIMGAFIGDAMGVGPHWYYDLEELRRDYGPWITEKKRDTSHIFCWVNTVRPNLSLDDTTLRE